MRAGNYGIVASDSDGEVRERGRAWEDIAADAGAVLGAADILVVIPDDGGRKEEEGSSGV